MKRPHPQADRDPSARFRAGAPARRASAVLLGLLASCASTPDELDPDETPAAVIAVAQRLIAEGETEDAVEELADLRRRRGLAPEELNRTEAELTAAVETHIDACNAGDDPVGDLLDLFDIELPRRLQARAGIAAASAQLADGDRREAFDTIRRLDRRDPGHVEHIAAGNIVASAGFSLANDPGSYFLGLATYRGFAPTVLEYLVLNYPSHPRCADAYSLLAELYEENGDWELAIARHEELVLYHRNSPYVVASELSIPALRMRQLLRIDYDRGGLVKARGELRTWLARHPGHALETRARELWSECLRRLAQNDMSVAQFYLDVERPYGAWQHAERALSEAQEGGDRELVEEIESFLAALPPLDRLLTDIGPPDAAGDPFGSNSVDPEGTP